MTPDNDPKDAIKQLTKEMEEQIRGGTLDAPSWEILRVARVAQRLYAPLGTDLSLGEYIRLNQRFVDLFAHKRRRTSSLNILSPTVEKKEFKFDSDAPISDAPTFVEIPEEINIDDDDAEDIDLLAKDLKVQPQTN
jgi:hypothetical protein